MRSLPQLIAKYLETGTGDIQTLAPGLGPGTINGVLTVNGGIQVNGILNVTSVLTSTAYSVSTIDTSGTPGNATVSGFGAGVAAFTAGTSSLVLTNGNSNWTATTKMFTTLATNDATATIGAAVFNSASSFTLNLKTNCTGTTKVFWMYFLG